MFLERIQFVSLTNDVSTQMSWKKYPVDPDEYWPAETHTKNGLA